MKRQLHHPMRGAAAVEFLFCLPLLLMLLIPVVDLARVIQANMVLTNISREGANLASRTSVSPQDIMASLAATALPLDMRTHGTIHITRILASKQNGINRNVVIGQHRWSGGADVARKGVWACGAAGTYWDADGNCAGLQSPANAPEVDFMPGLLDDGEIVHLVEVFYRFPLLFGTLNLGNFALPSLNPALYAMTVF